MSVFAPRKVNCPYCKKPFQVPSKKEMQAYFNHRSNCHVDYAKHFKDLPVYTVAEARSKSKYKIYAEYASEVLEDRLTNHFYAEMHIQEDVKDAWNTKNPLIGYRRWGRGWQWFCKIKPDETISEIIARHKQ